MDKETLENGIKFMIEIAEKFLELSERKEVLEICDTYRLSGGIQSGEVFHLAFASCWVEYLKYIGVDVTQQNLENVMKTKDNEKIRFLKDLLISKNYNSEEDLKEKIRSYCISKSEEKIKELNK